MIHYQLETVFIASDHGEERKKNLMETRWLDADM